MHNPAHRRNNILSRNFRHVGVGVAWGSPSAGGPRAGIYTADVGYKR